MPKPTRTVQRKLLGILLLVGFAPALVLLVYNLSVLTIGFENLLGTFLQDRAEQASTKVDAALESCFADFEKVRAATVSGREPDTGSSESAELFKELLLSDRQGTVLSTVPGTTTTQTQVLPGLVRGTSTSQILLSEAVIGTQDSELILQAYVDDARVLTAIVSTSEIFRSSGEPIGTSFLRVYSNRGLFPAQPDDHVLRRMAVEQDQQLRERIAGWISSGEKRTKAGSLVGFADSKLLRMMRSEGATTVEWTTLARMDMQEVSWLLSFMIWRNVLFAALLAPLLVGLSYLLARRFLAPVRAMHMQAQKVGQGDLDARAEVRTGDELEQLADAFNTMTDRLRASRDSLERYLQSVEKKARQISLASTISRNLIGPFDLEHLGRVTHEELKALVPYDALTLVVFSDGELLARRFSFLGDVFAECPDLEVQEVCEDAFSRQTPGIYPAALRMDAPSVKALADLRFEHCCIVPLRAQSGFGGVLALARVAGQDFSGEECMLLEQIGGVLAVGIEHIGLYERTRMFATELEQKVEERATELQRAQEQLFRIERFAATGRLAANIAHEINNPLGVIKNYLHLFRNKQRELDPSSAEALGIVQEELDRIARIVRNLLDFYPPGAEKPQLLNFSREIEQLMPLVVAGLRRRQITLEEQYAADLPLVEMPRDYLRQILLNLLKNAEDAVQDGGLITIRTRLLDDSGGAMVELQVEDDGCGIALEDQAQVFEPFFTRKRDGQGTGLGLAVTYGIVQSLGGTIHLVSKPGRGTTFTVVVPCRSEAQPAGTASSLDEAAS